MCRLRNIALESVTDGQTDRRTTEKVIPMCRYASQATQKSRRNRRIMSFVLYTRYRFCDF